MKTSSTVHPRRVQTRKLEGGAQDPYLAIRKLKSPTACTECRAVFEKGRWRWGQTRPAIAHQGVCPACQRIHDRCPAGRVSLKGAFVREHRDEVIDIVRSEQRKETADHPLNRIMSIAADRGGLLVTTTDVHLPRLIGEALRRSHGGELRVRYDVHGCAVRVDWVREA